MLAAELQRIRDTFGYAILYDAHSIRSSVPRLFDGRLTDLNLGSARGTACAPEMAAAALNAGQDKGYSIVLDGRFVGGHITRHYGRPTEHIHALQMELIWDLYMQEELPYPYARDKAAKLQPVLRDILQAMLDWGRAVYGR
jgi:formiminoglutamase